MAPKRRRTRGEGAVFKRASDGLWVGTLDLGVVDGHRRRKAVYGQSEREVLRKAGDRRRPARQADPGACAATCYRDTEQSDITRYPTQRFYVAARVQADPERPG